MAQKIFEVVMSYLDRTARQHACAGFDCAVCSLHNERGTELHDEIARELRELAPYSLLLAQLDQIESEVVKQNELRRESRVQSNCAA